MAAIRRAAANVDKAEAGLRDARAAFRQAIRDANAAGVSLAAIGRELGITRQRVGQLLERE